MWKYVRFVCLVTCVSSGALKAQIPDQFQATVGIPYSFDYAEAIGLNQIPAILPADFSFSYTFTAASDLPPGLTVSAGGLLSGTPTQAGNFQYSINFTFSESYMGQSYSDTIPLGGFLVVSGNSGPPVRAVPGTLGFSLSKGSSSAVSQSLVITNQGSKAQNFTLSAATDSGGDWLSLNPSSGTIAPFSSASVAVNASAGSLSAGTYLGSITGSVSPANQPISVAVTVTVSGGEPELRISQSGLFFQTVATGGTPPLNRLAC